MKKLLDLNKLAKENGYRDKMELLMDYRFIPTVLTPKHKKIGIVGLVLKSIFSKKKTS